ncbi:hypothetical protein [Streptomyces scabiei]|uniref:hypothetical protein n=1 Tax=Streptomyces scabiei TaxID=1930 RepID=UPI002FF20F68
MHEALDQIGALLGPLTVAGVLALTGDDYAPPALAVALPVVAAIALLVWLAPGSPTWSRVRRGPSPQREVPSPAAPRLPRAFCAYPAFTAVALTGLATFGVLSYHLVTRHLQYAAAMRTPWRRWPPAGATTASDPAS